MATAKDCHALTTYYEKLYEQKYGSKPNVNRYRSRWGFDSVLMSMSMHNAKELLEYYFTTSSEGRHSLTWFFNNYESLMSAKSDSDTDKEHRKKLMEESKRRAQEWRKSGKHRITSD